MNYEKEKKHDHLFTEWENKFITNLNKDKEINKTENPNKEIIFRKKNPQWELKKQIPNGNKRFPKQEQFIIDIDYEDFTDLLKI